MNPRTVIIDDARSISGVKTLILNPSVPSMYSVSDTVEWSVIESSVVDQKYCLARTIDPLLYSLPRNFLILVGSPRDRNPLIIEANPITELVKPRRLEPPILDSINQYMYPKKLFIIVSM